MRSLIRFTSDSIGATVEALDRFWSTGGTPVGSTRDREDLCGTVGGWLDFYGIVRGEEAPGVSISGLDYEANQEMAIHQMSKIADHLSERYPILAMLVIHRIGIVPVGEPSLLVRILSPHRKEALNACADFIDELKTWVPIWKHPIPAEAADPE